ncbi:cyclin-A1 isoform X2 [Lates calcarifer]|nr:cyclin-A1 isoform X2 [Lates calcarifer]XP_050934653.1 cyclin-A1 isoform X2 [Lates calcarifer]XP_050934654.1 cyclin-A1 isoform X2 [Lates calcarifer]XP_050934655.1 cyclin-A1 isoform X2 [Lates calcarifer]XP_050934656.1 cyclin-A1 isoform X2 [Lates calcarifer]XP_050934657.1 cyclin-A1 isoform X2 [Lates calcarifer]
MNFNTNAHCGSHTRKENIQPSSKIDASLVQRTKQRTVLGVLSENEQRGRSLSQGSQFSKHSSVSDSSQHTFLRCPSSSSYDVYVEEACEVVLAASGQEVVSDSYYLHTQTAALQNEDLRLLLELSSSSCQDASMQSESDDSLMLEGVLCVSEYADDIHRHLRESEVKLRPRPGYLEKHPEITSSMRVILVDWLVEVVQEYQLHSETLYLAVNYLDRFLSCTAYLKRGKLQLVGTAALLIASKYEEIFPPELNEFVYITDSTYTKKQLVRMEHVFLRALAFKMAAPTTNQFLRLFMSVHSVCANTESLALYVAELSLLEIEPFIQYTPSIVAAAAYCLAAYTVNKSLWVLSCFLDHSTCCSVFPMNHCSILLSFCQNICRLRTKQTQLILLSVSYMTHPSGHFIIFRFFFLSFMQIQ